MSIATIGELREMLEQYEDDQPVRIAFQPSWPLAARVAAVSSAEDFEDPDEGEEDNYEREGERGRTVWLAASEGVPYDEHPYAPRGAWMA